MFRAFEFCIPTRGTKVPHTPDWIHEIKFDGYRLRVERAVDRVRLITRPQKITFGEMRDTGVRGLVPACAESWILLVVVAGKMLADDLHSVFGFHFVEKPSAAQ
jgi:tetrahydromethanopterin S-methyltransferase subunit F